VPGFEFNREQVNRGMLDIMILGDTRCGKGFVSERLSKFYGLGQVASAENCTFAGLIGGVQQIGKQNLITWGLIPLNHGRLVIIDETSCLTEREIGRMSRVRSEGVAEITKIVQEKTHASCRLIWLSNTRSGKSLATYSTGIQAVKELVGANEDISRFDFIMSVATEEVDSKTINVVQTNGQYDKSLFPREAWRNLVLWAWSRKPEQVIFEPDAIKFIIQKAIEFGKNYSAAIPLVQAENIRIKLAKLSAAVAARVFNTDETYQNLIVTKDHVECATLFLEGLYRKPSFAYDMFSNRNKASIAKVVKPILRNGKYVSSIVDAINVVGEERASEVIKALVSLETVTVQSMADFVGDDMLTRNLISNLVKLDCLHLDDGAYVRHPNLKNWLTEIATRTGDKP
jgi:hypothetical protein